MDGTAGATLENKKTTLPERWTYDYFREYLLSLTRGSEFTLPQEAFPLVIELSRDWHTVLNTIREETSKDEIERWAGIGFKEDRRSLYLPIFPAKGLHDIIPGELITKELEKMQSEFGMTAIIGDIHSHPQKLPRDTSVTHIEKPLEGTFSVYDLYCAVKPSNPLQVMGLVDGYENVFSFRSKGSVMEDLRRRFLFPTNQEDFAKYWYELNGYRYEKSQEDTNGYAVRQVPNPPSHWEICKQIAQRHRLVLYKGSENGDLRKINLPPATI